MTLYMPDANMEQMRWFNDLQRRTASPERAFHLHEAVGQIDVRALLPVVRAPTLVAHCRDDGAVPFEDACIIVTEISGARFLPLEGRNHIVLETEPAWERFLAEMRASLAADDL